MKKISFLVVLLGTLLLVGCWKKKVDIKDTDFEYDVPVCDEYFELVDCLIEKDTNETFTDEIREELKVKVKNLQEDLKLLGEEELTKNCRESLERIERGLKENNLDSFGCYKKA